MKTLLTCIAAVLLTLVAHAQSPDQRRARSFRLISVDEVYDDLYYARKGVAVRLFATPAAVSRPQVAPTEKTLTLFRQTPPPADAPAGTPPTRTVVAEIAYPANLAEGLVILGSAGENAPLPVAGVALPDLPKLHTPGTARLINLSSLQAALGLNNDVASAAPQATQSVVSFSPGVTELKVAVQGRNGGWAPVVSSQCNLMEGLRIYAVLVDAPPQFEAAPPARAIVIYEYHRPPPSAPAHALGNDHTTHRPSEVMVNAKRVSPFRSS